MKLLEGILVLDFSQFLSGPSASLRLADLGARVIKIEKPEIGDICRTLYVSDTEIAGDSTLFHAINRNKESFVADLKRESDIEKIHKLIRQADIVMHNFRPGVMQRLGFDYDSIKAIKEDIVYAEISGYGEEGPWSKLPGQDLLLQALSGLTYLNNTKEAPPTPMGVSVVDILAGTHLAQGILAALYRRENTGLGQKVEVNMLESALDYQFEVFTTFLNDGESLPERCENNHAHAYVAAPYGVYQTADAHLALAMGDIPFLGKLLGCKELEVYTDKSSWFPLRDEIKTVLAKHLTGKSTQYWLDLLEPADIWCAEVFDYGQLRKQEGYRQLNMEMDVKHSNGGTIKTTRCPIRVNGQLLTSNKAAPTLGQQQQEISKEFDL
ncbi:CaiB/BaiF CoA transferase family protein [Belliella marina]|uniref:CaiB/BaiF CoA transferase family protein n=1 Tax=Belliella marina TaxID=1644146 RepID=A0ABW4VQU1_9BACT